LETKVYSEEVGSRGPIKTNKQLQAEADEKFHATLRLKKGPLGWAMRYLHENQQGPGMIYEINNLKTMFKRIPAMVVVAALYGMNYDIHNAQMGIEGTPEGDRMEMVYAHATKYSNEVEHTYSFIQLITA